MEFAIADRHVGSIRNEAKWSVKELRDNASDDTKGRGVNMKNDRLYAGQMFIQIYKISLGIKPEAVTRARQRYRWEDKD